MNLKDHNTFEMKLLIFYHSSNIWMFLISSVINLPLFGTRSNFFSPEGNISRAFTKNTFFFIQKEYFHAADISNFKGHFSAVIVTYTYGKKINQ